MKPKMKMLAANYSKNNSGNKDDYYDKGEYYKEDDRARMGYEKSEWYPMEENELESYRRRRYKNGRFAPKSKSYDDYRENPRVIGFTSAAMKNRKEEPEWENDDMRHSYSSQYEEKPLDREMAESWTRGMRNEDGTKGPHWAIDQVRGVMAQRGINLDPWEFYVAINMVYSDYYKVLKKYGVGDKLDVYVDLASAFLKDQDAAKDKLARYFEYVVKD